MSIAASDFGHPVYPRTPALPTSTGTVGSLELVERRQDNAEFLETIPLDCRTCPVIVSQLEQLERYPDEGLTTVTRTISDGYREHISHLIKGCFGATNIQTGLLRKRGATRCNSPATDDYASHKTNK